jgi:hypothetical protein
MSEENVELTRRAFVAFNREGVEAFDNTDLWSPEIVFDATPSGVPGLGVYRGYDEVSDSSRRIGSESFPSRSGSSSSRS